MGTKEHHPLEILADELRRTVAPESLGFTSTDALPPPTTLVGQERGLEAITFALAIKDRTYNLYVSGDAGVGRSTAVVRAVNQVAQSEPSGQDWCYVYHFERPGQPMALALPPGSAPDFAHAIDLFVAACRRELHRAFTSDAYRQKRKATLKNLDDQREQLLEGLQREAHDRGFALQLTPAGVATIPLKRPKAQFSERLGLPFGSPPESGGRVAEPMTPAEFAALPEAEQERIDAASEALQTTVADTLAHVESLSGEARLRLHDLNETVARRVVAPLAESLASQYRDASRVADYIHHLESDIVAHAEILLMTARGASDEDREDSGTQQKANASEESSNSGADGDVVGLNGDEQEEIAATLLLRHYRVNVLVTHREPHIAPVVHEINPSYANLVGHIEFGLRGGLPVTDHLMLKPGSLHRANGGYLIVYARDLFKQPNAWQAVKRTLRFGVISLEDGDEAIALPASASLRPEPVPASLKVILIGDPQTYAILDELDPEFSELFKVRADFDNSIPHTPEVEQFYAQFIGDAVRGAGLPPLRADAVALCIEEGGRQVADQARLSAVLSDVRDLALEAANAAATGGPSPATTEEPVGAGERFTTREHVMHVLAARERRLNLAADHIDEMIREGTILIDTRGEAIGQINGLTVLLSGGYAFGMPARITARTAPGLAGIVNIERETMMSGPAHSKGILVLGGYLAGRFARKQPLSLSASICLEQVYGEIEGDSASSAELYALLSSLSGLPLKQPLAVTGSVNQHGVVQAIGGVNEKIEGFFRVCAQGQLTGEHGVIIPRANVRNLMLRQEVIDAVRAGAFHIYAVSTIDEGIELLTGIPAGMADADGYFSADTVNGRVGQTLREFTQSMREHSAFPPGTNQHVAGFGSAYTSPNGAR